MSQTFEPSHFRPQEFYQKPSSAPAGREASLLPPLVSASLVGSPQELEAIPLGSSERLEAVGRLDDLSAEKIAAIAALLFRKGLLHGGGKEVAPMPPEIRGRGGR